MTSKELYIHLLKLKTEFYKGEELSTNYERMQVQFRSNKFEEWNYNGWINVHVVK